MAVDVLIAKGVPEDRILFLNVIASPEGVTRFAERFPKLRVVTAFVDQGLDEKKYKNRLRVISTLIGIAGTLFLALETLVIDFIHSRVLRKSWNG